jgi:transcriptional regulator with XRE-family HTH domain
VDDESPNDAELARRLYTLRKASGLSGTQLGRKVGLSQPQVSRIETGGKVPTVDELEQILTVLDASEEDFTEIMQLAHGSTAEYFNTRNSRRRGLHLRQDDLSTMMNRTGHLRFFLPTMLTGLLQTPDYASASMTYFQEQALTKRLERQKILYDKEKRFTFLLTEGAVRWPVLPPAGMAMQVDRLISLARLPHIEIGVIPHNGNGGLKSVVSIFTLYDTKMVITETYAGEILQRDPKDVAQHTAIFENMSGHALWGAESVALLNSVAGEFAARG